jgi:hypothetical protein
MPQPKDLTGQTIGRLTFLEVRTEDKKRFWKVRCQCGEELEYRSDYLSTMKCRGTKFECTKCKLERKSPTLTNKVFGRLTVVKEVPSRDGHHRWWLCRCECGVEKEIPGIRLNPKFSVHATKSCGCLARKLNSKWCNTTQYPPAHQLRSKSTTEINKSLYECRNAMVSACYRSDDHRYINHGNLGHTVCDLWRNGAKDFVNFALKNGYKSGDAIFLKKGKTIFSPDNCYFMSRGDFHKINNSKMIEWDGKTQSITDWANELGCTTSCLSLRLKKYHKYGLDKIMDLSWVAKKNYNYGTEHFEPEIVRMYVQGKTYLEIGLALGCSSSTILRFLKKNKIKPRPAKCRSSLNKSP